MIRRSDAATLLRCKTVKWFSKSLCRCLNLKFSLNNLTTSKIGFKNFELKSWALYESQAMTKVNSEKQLQRNPSYSLCRTPADRLHSIRFSYWCRCKAKNRWRPLGRCKRLRWLSQLKNPRRLRRPPRADRRSPAFVSTPRESSHLLRGTSLPCTFHNNCEKKRRRKVGELVFGLSYF